MNEPFNDRFDYVGHIAWTSRLSDESVFCEDKRPFEAKLACDFGKKDVKERFGA
jgi:hypothetical protein